jgi:hypothetical protein
MKKWTLVLFLVVLIVATFFRLYNLQSAPPGLYPDEAMNGSNAQEAIATGNYKLFYPENNGREGLFINIQAQFLKLFGVHEPWALRFASTLFGTLTVVGLFLLILELYKVGKGFSPLEAKMPLTGLVAAFSGSFLMAVSFWHVNFSRIGFRAIMAPFFIVWSMYFLLVAFRRDNPNNTPYAIRYSLYALSGLIFGLGMHSYIAYRALPLFVLIVFVLFWKLFSVPFKKIFLSFTVFVLGALISTAPLIGYFAQHPQDFFGRTSQISIFSSENPLLSLLVNTGKSLLMFFWFGDYNWRHNFSGMGELYPAAALLFLVGIIVGVLSLRGAQRRGNPTTSFIFLFAASLFLVALLPTVVSSEGLPHALRAILMIPAVFILVGMGFEYLFTKLTSTRLGLGLGRPSLVALLTLFFLLLPAVHTYYLYFVDWANRQETKDSFAQNYVDLGHQLTGINNSFPKYMVVEAGGVEVRGIPMPAQTVMFLTDTFTPEKQKKKNLFYVLPSDADKIPSGAQVFYLK